MLHQHHLLVGNFHFPLIKEANRLFATPMLPANIIPRPRKEVNPFRGAFLLRVSPGNLPAFGRNGHAAALRRRRRAGGLPRGGARGSAPSPLRSRNQIFRMQTRRRRARISVYPLARACPRPAIITSRRKATSTFPALRAPVASEPFPKARRGYFINISLYIIVDTVVFLTPLSGTFEPAAVPKYLPFPSKRNSPRTVPVQGLFFICSIHVEKRGRATLLFPVQFPAGSSSAHHDNLLGGRQQSHIFPSFMRNPVS